MIPKELQILLQIIYGIKNKKMKNKLIPIQDALNLMLTDLKEIKQTETVCISKCEGRILAENIYGDFDIPENDNSALDGYAFNYELAKKKGFKNLKIVGKSRPGKPFLGRCSNGEAIKIYTGAYILHHKKQNVDTVVMEEDCDSNLKEIISMKNIPSKGSNIRKRGEDVRKSNALFKKKTKLRVVDVCQLSSIGIKTIKVIRKIKVGIFSTGDELQDLSQRKKKYHIYDANRLVLSLLLEKFNCDVIDLGIIRDKEEETSEKILRNINYVDFMLTSGGISSSSTDKVSNFIRNNGKLKFWKLAIKPGRPMALGTVNKKTIIGLPGNPVAAIVTFLMLVTKYINKISGISKKDCIPRYLPSNFHMEKKYGRTEWLRGKIIVLRGKYFIDKFETSGSGIISSISNTDGIIELDEKLTKISKGMLLKFYRYEDLLI